MAYYDKSEKIRTCPKCGKVLICGPPMSSEDKKIMQMTKGYTYSNYYKHIFQEHCKQVLSGERLNALTDDERHDWIEKEAKAYLEAL